MTLAGKRDELYPGNYTLASDMSYSDAIDAISTPPVSRTINITIPEGLSRSQIAPILRDAGVSGNYLQDSAAYGNFDPGEYGAGNPENLEGFLFPATYELPAKGTTRQLVARQLDAFKQRMAGVDLSYAKSKNLTAYDVLIIASMIEREVQIPEERRLVSAVIYNRLKDDIPLGIDATIRFAVDNYTEPLTVSQLETRVALQHPAQPRPAAGADRQSRPSRDRGSGEPGARRLSLLRRQARDLRRAQLQQDVRGIQRGLRRIRRGPGGGGRLARHVLSGQS